MYLATQITKCSSSHVHQQEAHETNTIEVVRNDGLSRVQTLQIPNTTPLPLRSPITELQHAIYNTSISKVSKFLSTQPLIIKCDDTRYHALHSAAALGIMHCNCNEAVEICRKLIEAGADVLVKDKDGNTALHWAARSGHCGVIKLLLNRNCPIGMSLFMVQSNQPMQFFNLRSLTIFRCSK